MQTQPRPDGPSEHVYLGLGYWRDVPLGLPRVTQLCQVTVIVSLAELTQANAPEVNRYEGAGSEVQQKVVEMSVARSGNVTCETGGGNTRREGAAHRQKLLRPAGQPHEGLPVTKERVRLTCRQDYVPRPHDFTPQMLFMMWSKFPPRPWTVYL
jgi:hypothetical protein